MTSSVKPYSRLKYLILQLWGLDDKGIGLVNAKHSQMSDMLL